MDYVFSELAEQVMAARAAHRPLRIRAGGTKDFYGETGAGVGANGAAVLDVSGYKGILNYEPSELVVTARAGTLLSDIEQALAQRGQMLAFEPPRFGAASTIGGVVASGLSGPRRMAAGSARDFVLGARLLDSVGNHLRFGGEVMKNVAGYDVARLLAGSLGTLGLLTEVSVKVAPVPFHETTLVLAASQAQALDWFGQWRGRPLPISATSWLEEDGQGVLRLRLSGSASAVNSAMRTLGGQRMDDDAASAWWNSLRDQTHPFFQQRPLWRLAVAPLSEPLPLGPTLIEWNGGLRWVAGQQQGGDAMLTEAVGIRIAAARAGGHATLYRYGAKPRELPVFQPQAAGPMGIQRRLKQQFDPVGVFNPRRLFTEF